MAVSWAYGGGRPGGEVAEKKDEGEIAIQSKRGNTIKRNAEPDNPAVHVSRPGNDVVKRQSELDVEEKTAEGAQDDGNNATADEKPEGGLEVPATNGDQKEKSKSPAPKKTPAPKKSPAPKEKSPAVSKKRKAEEEKPEEDEEAAAAEEPPAKKARGRPKGAGTPKAAAAAPPAKEKKTAGRKAGAPKKADAPKEALGEEEPSKKGRGRPKGSGSGAKAPGAAAKKAKKPPAKAVNGTVGSRTRSTKK
ncbi:MAG: hypothetical protein Q9216_005878 [Gyalolechia sp. 2 TL-2023]